MNQPTPDHETPTPQESLHLIAEQQAKTNRALGNSPLMYWGPWGVAWLIGFALFTLRYGLNGQPYVAMPGYLPLIVLFILMGCAAAITATTGLRARRHVTGVSNTQGLWFGLTWLFGFVSVTAIGIRMSVQLPDTEAGLLWAGMAVGLTGALYMAGAAIWHTWELFAMGLWITGVNAVGVACGPGWHALLVSMAGGGGLLVAGTVLHLRQGRCSR